MSAAFNGPRDGRSMTATPQSAPPLVFDQVTKRYGARVAIDRLSLAFPAARTTALLGPSGCGKSTLLRLATGIVAPDAGQVRLFGAPLPAGDLLEALRHRIGYVIQDGGLFPHLDVEGNVMLVARHLRWAPARRQARFAELRDLVKLPADVGRRGIDEISGGQRQRVSLMRALVLDPPLLLLDEPLGALDPMVRSEMQQDLASLFRALRKTVVLVTHDVAECAVLADEVVLLRDGAVEQRAPLAQLLDAAPGSFAQAFLSAQRGAREILAMPGA
jgi:osmoprotectant transport system ATP-binding protein